MTRRDNASSVVDVREAAQSIVFFTEGSTRETFLASDEKQSAVILKIIVMGEATKRLSMDFRSRFSSVPWTDIAGMRDRLVHGYDDWDLDLVWSVATREVPALIPKLDDVLRSL